MRSAADASLGSAALDLQSIRRSDARDAQRLVLVAQVHTRKVALMHEPVGHFDHTIHFDLDPCETLLTAAFIVVHQWFGERRDRRRETLEGDANARRAGAARQRDEAAHVGSVIHRRRIREISGFFVRRHRRLWAFLSTVKREDSKKTLTSAH